MDKCDFLASYGVIFGALVSIFTIFDSKIGLFRALEHNIRHTNLSKYVFILSNKLIYPNIIILVDLGDFLASYFVIFGALVSILTIFNSKFGVIHALEHHVNIQKPPNVFLYRQIKLIYP